MKKLSLCIIAFILATSFSCLALADNYPSEHITIIVPAVPGGTFDAVARSIAAVGTEHFGVGFIIRNVPGAGFTIGTAEVANAKPDGYTLLSASSSAVSFSPHLMELEYDVYDFEHIAQIASGATGIYAHVGSNYTDLDEVLKYAKENPNKLKVSVSAAMQEMWAQVLATKGYEFVVIPFAGGAAAAASAASGVVDLFFGAWVPASGFVESGDLVTLMMTPGIDLPADVPEGTPTIDDYPEVKELFGPLYLASSAIFAPRGIPEERLKFIDEALLKTFNDPAFQSIATRLGLVPSYMPRDEVTQFMIDSYVFVGKLIEELSEKQ